MSSPEEIRSRIKGPVVGLPTLFTQDFQVNYAGIHQHVDFLIDRGIKVLMLSVGVSEYGSLSYEEIKMVAQTVAQATAGRATVIAETGPWWTGQAVEFAKYAEDVGVDALMVIPPELYYLPYDPSVHDDALYRHFETVASATKSAVLFHLRALRGRGTARIWSMPLIERVAAIGNVVGMKDESTSLFMAFEMLGRLGDKIALIDDGTPTSFYYTYRCGSPAYISGMGQFAPHLDLKFYSDLRRGALDNACDFITNVVSPYIGLMRRLNWVATIKACMDLGGLPGGPMRPPTPDLTPTQRADLGDSIAKLGMLEE